MSDTDIRRRDFLAGLALTLAAISIARPAKAVDALMPLPSLPEMPLEMGEAVHWANTWGTNRWGEGPWGGDELAWVADMLRQRARANLSPGARFEIRLGMPTDYGRMNTAAWYSHRKFLERPTWAAERFEPPVFQEELGVYLISREVA